MFVAVVDYGMGNLRSVVQALRHVATNGTRIEVTQSADVLREADRIVFPGQGAIRDSMAALDRHGLREPLINATREKPFLGICIGLQALMQKSDEHEHTDGLGVYEGRVIRFESGVRDPGTGDLLKIPHMGWNQVFQAKEHPVWHGVEDGARFYFVHSFYVTASDLSIVAGEADYGVRFTCAVAGGNIFAVQFHPEKSQHDGLKLLENFLAWPGE